MGNTIKNTATLNKATQSCCDLGLVHSTIIMIMGHTLIQVPPSSKFCQVPSSKFRVPSSEFQVPSSKFRQVPSSKFPVYYYYIGFYSILLNFYRVLQNILHNGFMLRKSQNRNGFMLIPTFRRCYLKFYSPVQSWVVVLQQVARSCSILEVT